MFFDYIIHSFLNSTSAKWNILETKPPHFLQLLTSHVLKNIWEIYSFQNITYTINGISGVFNWDLYVETQNSFINQKEFKKFKAKGKELTKYESYYMK